MDYRKDILVRPDADVDKEYILCRATDSMRVNCGITSRALSVHAMTIMNRQVDVSPRKWQPCTILETSTYVRATYAAGFRAPGVDELLQHVQENG